jgi:hypothetical protein
VADAALALALLQARGDRRLWGKIFEKAHGLRATFDAASLSTFLWASGAAGVQHFKSVFDMSAAAARLLPSLTPQQVGIVVEALGRAGAADGDLFRAVSERVSQNAGSMAPADLARVLWGFAAAGVEDGRLAKAAGAALASKADAAAARDLAQASWALAKLRRSADKPTLESLAKALSSKLGAANSTPQDAAAAAWAFATLGHAPAAQAAGKAAAAALSKPGAAAELTPSTAADAAWALALIGGNAEAVQPLLARVAEAIAAAPDAVPVAAAGAAAEAAALSGKQLPPSVASYCRDMRALLSERALARATQAQADWKRDVARAGARALVGARYKPEVDKASAAAQQAPLASAAGDSDGVAADLTFDLGGADGKVAIVLATPEEEGASGAGHLGAAEARRRVLEAASKAGFKGAAVVTPTAWRRAVGGANGAAAEAAGAAAVLEAVKAQCPALSGKVAQLQRKLAEPFDPYA